MEYTYAGEVKDLSEANMKILITTLLTPLCLIKYKYVGTMKWLWFAKCTYLA